MISAAFHQVVNLKNKYGDYIFNREKSLRQANIKRDILKKRIK